MTQHSAPYYDINIKGNRPIMVDIKHQDEDKLTTGSYYKEESSDMDNTEWEDEEEEPRNTPERRSQTSYATRTSPRKRTKATTQSQSHARRKTYPTSPKPIPYSPKVQPIPIFSREEALHGALEAAMSGLQYMWGVSRIAFKLAYVPLSILVFVLLLAFIVDRTSHTIRVAFSPLCIFPGISSSMWCHPPSTSVKEAKWADFPKLMDAQSKTFEDLMLESIGAPVLSLEIKNAEMATKDLVVVIKHSDLKARESLVSILNDLIVDARRTAGGLGKLASKVGGAVDSIMAANDYAINSIESARASQPTSWSMGAVVPWTKPKKTLDEVVTKSFDEAMHFLSQQMERLIIEAGANLQNLNNLEERLMTLHEVVLRENSSILTAKNELLAELWTVLGGNKGEMRNFDKNLDILKNLRAYREEAKARVVATLHTLQTMQDDMEEMRERVAAPDLLGSSIPVEVHMKSIRIGLERLKEWRIKSQKLEEEKRRRLALAHGFGDED